MTKSYSTANKQGWITKRKKYSKEQISEMGRVAVMGTERYKRVHKIGGYKQDENAE